MLQKAGWLGYSQQSLSEDTALTEEPWQQEAVQKEQGESRGGGCFEGVLEEIS